MSLRVLPANIRLIELYAIDLIHQDSVAAVGRWGGWINNWLCCKL